MKHYMVPFEDLPRYVQEEQAHDAAKELASDSSSDDTKTHAALILNSWQEVLDKESND